MKLDKRSKKSNIRKLLLLSFVVIAAGAATSYFALQSTKNENTQGTINYGPVTNDEKKDAEDHKKDIAENDESQSETQNNDSDEANGEKKKVVPFITVWGQESAGGDFKLNGFIPSVIEIDGNCTLTMTRGGRKVTKTRAALADAKNTTCGQTVIPYDSLEPGEWKATLSYNSPHSGGSSEVTIVEVK